MNFGCSLKWLLAASVGAISEGYFFFIIIILLFWINAIFFCFDFVCAYIFVSLANFFCLAISIFLISIFM